MNIHRIHFKRHPISLVIRKCKSTHSKNTLASHQSGKTRSRSGILSIREAGKTAALSCFW